MKSPFPVMDPYLESRWSDVHQRLCTYACDQMQEQLGGDLIARLGERLVVESLLDERRTIYPDVRVVEHGLEGIELSSSAGSTAVAEPLVIKVGGDPEPQAYIEIIEPDSGRLITVVEFLSASNKLSGDGRQKYQQKQRELYEARVNLVEIDLLRAGPRVFLLPEVQFPPGTKAAYFACVFRGYRPEEFELYPISLREKLPAIRIPLRQGEPDIALDLQQLIDHAYTKGRYDRTNYQQPCMPPLQGEDAAWADQMIRMARPV